MQRAVVFVNVETLNAAVFCRELLMHQSEIASIRVNGLGIWDLIKPVGCTGYCNPFFVFCKYVMSVQKMLNFLLFLLLLPHRIFDDFSFNENSVHNQTSLFLFYKVFFLWEKIAIQFLNKAVKALLVLSINV